MSSKANFDKRFLQDLFQRRLSERYLEKDDCFVIEQTLAAKSLECKFKYGDFI